MPKLAGITLSDTLELPRLKKVRIEHRSLLWKKAENHV
jgi:hypothetical protein